MDESSLGPRRVKGKRGRGAGSTTIVFGLFKRNGKVYTEIVPDTTQRTRQAMVRGTVDSRSVIHSDSWRGHDGLGDMGYRKHHRVQPGQGVCALRRRDAPQRPRELWGHGHDPVGQSARQPADLFYLHLKECEFRFNHRQDTLNRGLLERLSKHPLN